MTTYRTTDLARWGVGNGSNLTPVQVDMNFWDIVARLLVLEALPEASAGIDHFEVVGGSFYVHLTDDTTILGPYTLPVALYRSTGSDWLPNFTYARLDTFTYNGGLYSVNVAHVSDATFDAGANNGSEDYYSLMFQTPGSSLPTGGAVGQTLQKSTSSDYAVTWGWKLPTDGTNRQYLIKQSGTNQDADWDVPNAADIDFDPTTSSALTSDTVDEALEELEALIGDQEYDASVITFTPVTGSLLVTSNVADALEELSVRLAIATTAEYLDNTFGKVLTTDKVWSAAAAVVLTDAATIAIDMETFINASVTLGGNRTLGNPTNTKPGQSGTIAITQDGTGTRTLAYASNWKFTGGVAPTLSTAAGAVDLLFYQVINATFIYATLVEDVS